LSESNSFVAQGPLADFSLGGDRRVCVGCRPAAYSVITRNRGLQFCLDRVHFRRIRTL